MKKTDDPRRQLVSAEISSDSLTGMVIFRPHYVSGAGNAAAGTTRKGEWYALRPGEVRSFARALLDAADATDLKSKSLQAAKSGLAAT